MSSHQDEQVYVSDLLLILLTVLVPPVGVYLVSGCGGDFLINVLLTILGYFPGHIHAFYVEYLYFKRREQIPSYRPTAPARQGYGTIPPSA